MVAAALAVGERKIQNMSMHGATGEISAVRTSCCAIESCLSSVVGDGGVN